MENKKIFVLCPSGAVSGGPEALHQLVYYINKVNEISTIVYLAERNEAVQIPHQYMKYTKKFILLHEIPDEKDIHIILPEVYFFLIDRFKNATVSIWWLSVNNAGLGKPPSRKNLFLRLYLKAITRLKLNQNNYMIKNAKARAIHYCQGLTNYVGSYYAYEFLKAAKISNVRKLIEPIGKTFLDDIGEVSFTSKNRSNKILYNPVKDFKNIIPRIAACNPELEFIALKGYSHHQMIDLFKHSKLYIDFGIFPGPERIPKEAVMCGCLILTGRFGASNYFGDVPIPDTYKIRSVNNLKKISSRINEMLKNYDTIISDFEAYRDVVKQLERNFEDTVRKTFFE